jgi:carbon storage regulator
MLVLSRQRDETIMIGDEIEITVVDIRGDKVRLGITAPTRIAVHRKEVYDAIRQENQRAAALAGPELLTLRSASAGAAPRAVSGRPLGATGTTGAIPATPIPTRPTLGASKPSPLGATRVSK